MNRGETFEAFFTNPSIDISLGAFVVNLALAALLAWLLSLAYVRWGRALSNRRAFGANFLLITTTTTLIISIVKSSLALSLGLVGALSIVRFRAAIKDPEELAFLFLAIAIGLGLGADQRVVTLLAFAGIVPLVAARSLWWDREAHPCLHLTVSSPERAVLGIDAMVRILREHCSEVSLQRFDEEGEAVEAAFSVEYEAFESLEASVEALREVHAGVRVSFLDARGVL